jgi:hypothetical protein
MKRSVFVVLDDCDPNDGLVWGLPTIRTCVEFINMLQFTALFTDNENEPIRPYALFALSSPLTFAKLDIAVGTGEDFIHFLTDT